MRRLKNRRVLLTGMVALFTALPSACGTAVPPRDPEDEDSQSEEGTSSSGRSASARDAGATRDAKSDANARKTDDADDDEANESSDQDQSGSEGEGEDEEGGSAEEVVVSPSGDSFFRVDSLVLKSPGVVLRPGGLEVRVTTQAQTGINDALVKDADPDNNGDGKVDSGDGDGLVDMSLLIRFFDADPAAGKGGKSTFGGGDCPYPYESELACGPNAALPFQAEESSYTNGTDCELDGTTHVAKGPCFATKKGSIRLSLPPLGDIPLEDGQVVGSWLNGGRGGIENGVIRGFLEESIARSTKLGDDLPPLAASLGIKPGIALAEFFPNGDRTTNEDGTSGWWFSLNFSAKPALFDEDADPASEAQE